MKTFLPIWNLNYNMIQILVMWPVVEQFSREPCFIYMAINCKEPTACCKMNSTRSDTVLKEAVLNSGQSQRLPSLGSLFLNPKLYYHKSCKNCLSLQGCSLSSVKAHERGEWSNSCDSSSLTFFLNFWVYTPYTHWQNKAKNLDQTSRHCIMKKVNQDFSYSIWREHFNLVSLHQIQRPHTNQQKKTCSGEKKPERIFEQSFFPFF